MESFASNHLPDDWIAARLDDVSELRKEQVNPAESCATVYVGLEHIEPGNPTLTAHGSPNGVRSAKSRFAAGDLLYGKLRPYLDKAVLSDREGICSTEILVLRPTPERADGGFLINVLHTPRFVQHAMRTTHGVNHPRTSWQSIAEFAFVLPPLREQRAIAAVLGKLQAAVAAQQAIIDRTAELKAALMAKLFTEGTRGEPTKESEAGTVPASWALKALGEVLTLLQYGLSTRGEPAGEYPILRMNCQRSGRVVFDNLQYVDLDRKTFDAYRLRPGDILFNRTNSIDLVGRTAIYETDRDAVFASYLIRLQPEGRELLPALLNHYLNWDRTQQSLKSLATRGVSQSNISAGKLKTFVVPLPSLDEQAEIIAVLDALDHRIAQGERQREICSELFAAMLDELMTGRIRVRDLDLTDLGVSANA